MKRRHFLGGMLTVAVSASLAPSAPAQTTAVDAPRKIRLGVIGCGGRGAWIAGLFNRHGGYEMHAVADYFQPVADACGDALGVDRTRRFSGLSGFQKLITSGVEAVACETPPYFIPEHAQAAVEAGLHVYMAKPVSADVPGCLRVQAAGALATQKKLCFLVDYQMPTDPQNLEAAKRFREGALGRLGMVKSFYYGGLFGDPPLTQNIESRLRSLIWCNDVAIGGGYHVNACIHPVQAMMWAYRSPQSMGSPVRLPPRLAPHRTWTSRR